MSYISGGTTIRGDINQALVEAPNGDTGLIGAEIFPLLPVPAKSGQYLKVQLAQADLLNNDSKARSSASDYARVTRSFGTDSYDAVEYGLEEVIGDDFKADADRFFDLEASSARYLLRQLKIGHEKRVSDIINAATTPFTTADQSAISAYTNANLANIDVAGDVAAARTELNKLGYEANAVLMSAPVFERIRRTTKLQNQFFGVVSDTKGRLLSEAEIAAALGVERVLVGRAAVNSANKNKSYSGGFIFPNTFITVANVQSGQFTAGGIGRTLVWSADAPGGFVTESYRDEARRSNVLRVRMNTAEKLIDANAGVRITTSFA